MARHLPRLTDGLERALDEGLVGRGALGLLQPRSPAISNTNAMQQTMGTRAHQVPRPGPGSPVRAGAAQPRGPPSSAERELTARDSCTPPLLEQALAPAAVTAGGCSL